MLKCECISKNKKEKIMTRKILTFLKYKIPIDSIKFLQYMFYYDVYISWMKVEK